MQVTTIGLDLAKQVFQVHGVDAEGLVALKRRLRRSEVVRFFSSLPTAWWALRQAQRRTIGRVSWPSSATL